MESALATAEAVFDHSLHISAGTSAANEYVAFAGASKISTVVQIQCTQVIEVPEAVGIKVIRDIVREESLADDWGGNPFDGRDSESCCGGGSTGVEEEKIA